MVSVSSQLSRELPKLSSSSTSSSSSSSSKSIEVIEAKSYTPLVRNRLADQNNRPMNQTYTIGTRSFIPTNQQHKTRERSCSIDSDIAEYTINGAISGLFPRSYSNNNKLSSSNNNNNNNNNSSNSNNISPPQNSNSISRIPSSSTLTRVFSTKLPSLDGCSPERKCCQRPFGRAQFDLQKFKETIKNAQ